MHQRRINQNQGRLSFFFVDLPVEWLHNLFLILLIFWGQDWQCKKISFCILLFLMLRNRFIKERELDHSTRGYQLDCWEWVYIMGVVFIISLLQRSICKTITKIMLQWNLWILWLEHLGLFALRYLPILLIYWRKECRDNDCLCNQEK